MTKLTTKLQAENKVLRKRSKDMAWAMRAMFEMVKAVIDPMEDLVKTAEKESEK